MGRSHGSFRINSFLENPSEPPSESSRVVGAMDRSHGSLRIIDFLKNPYLFLVTLKNSCPFGMPWTNNLRNPNEILQVRNAVVQKPKTS